MPKRFSASTAGMQMQCHASGNLDLAIPNWVEPVEDRTANNAANRGTNMHEIFAKAMELGRKDIRAMANAMLYIADLRETRNFKVLIEQTMTATWLDSCPTTTADLVLYTQDEIHMIDLKTGKIEVDATDNEQLLYGAVTYAAFAPRAKGVTCHILQPWAPSGFSSWFADTNVLNQFMQDAIAAERAIAAGDTTFMPGDHCTFCPANPHSRGRKGSPFCPELMQLYYPKPFDSDAILDL